MTKKIHIHLLERLLEQADTLELSRQAILKLQWFLFAARHEWNISLTCRHFGIARTTFVRWLDRFEPDNPRSLEEASRRPHRTRKPQTPDAVIQIVNSLRRDKPTLNKETISAKLRAHGYDVSPSTVGRIITRHKLFFDTRPSHLLKRNDENEGGNPLFDIALSLGCLLLFAVCGAVVPTIVSAAESTSFTLEGGGIGVGTSGLQSGSFYGQGDLDWKTTVLTGDEYVIVPGAAAGVRVAASSESSSSISSSSSITSSSGPFGGPAGNVTGRKSSSGGSSAPASSVSSRRSRSSRAMSSQPKPAAPAQQQSSLSRRSISSLPRLPGRLETQSKLRRDERLQKRRDDARARLQPPVVRKQEPRAPGSAVTLLSMSGALTAAAGFGFSRMAPAILLVEGGWSFRGKKKSTKRKSGRQKRFKRRLFSLLFLWISLSIGMGAADRALAASIPLTHMYDGRLLSSSGSPITTAVNIRFSYWSAADKIGGDSAGDGTINVGAPAYLSWQEVHTVTPDSNGYFSVAMGSATPLPSYASLPAGATVHLQVDVKDAAGANTAYETLDPNPADTAVDRTAIVSVPYASVAETLQRRSIGTGSGSIPLLGDGGTLPTAMMPGGTNADTLVLDANSSATNVILQFGATLAKTLTYSTAASKFTFNDDVHVEGDLTVSGTINGADLSSIITTDAEQITATVLHAAYEGALPQGDGADNVGQMSLSHDNLNLKNFYLWTSTRETLQDYDILVRVALPEQFVRWEDGLALEYRSTSADASNNKVDIQVYDTSGVPVSLSGQATGLASTSWQSTSLEFTGSPTWTPGGEILIRLKVSARNAAQMHLGDLKLKFVQKPLAP